MSGGCPGRRGAGTADRHITETHASLSSPTKGTRASAATHAGVCTGRSGTGAADRHITGTHAPFVPDERGRVPAQRRTQGYARGGVGQAPQIATSPEPTPLSSPTKGDACQRSDARRGMPEAERGGTTSSGVHHSSHPHPVIPAKAGIQKRGAAAPYAPFAPA